MLFSFVLKLNLKHLILILNSNSNGLEFEFKALIIIINKNINIATINKTSIISNTTPLSYDENHQYAKVEKRTTTATILCGKDFNLNIISYSYEKLI